MLNLAVLLEGTAREFGDRDAIVCGTTRLTYTQLDAAASQVANALIARGITKGDRIAVSCPNVPYFPVIYYGILKAGAVVVPLNILLTEREIAYHLTDCQAKAYFCFEGTPELPIGTAGAAAFDAAGTCEHFILLTADPAATSPEPHTETLAEFTHRQPTACRSAATSETDTALILYTSGTTGQAKGAELTHSNMVQNAQLAGRLFGTHSRDVHLIALPLFHSFGQSVQLNAGLASAATIVLLPRFSAEQALAQMEREKVTFFAGVPTMYHALTEHQGGATLAGLRVAVSGGAPMPAETMRRFEEKFGVPVLEGYGLSETSPIATFNRIDRRRKPGSIGLPVWGVEVEVVTKDGAPAPIGEPGEIVIRGHNVMKGYFARPEATAEAIDGNGWFHSGDIGTRDADGYLYVVDRKKDMIIRGGFNVYPREVEEVLLTHPQVRMVAVIGVPHEVYGEEVKAVVVRTAGASITESELVAWCRQNLAAYKYPRIVEFAGSLPLTATGKVLKRELVQKGVQS
ncbi:MAG TPA: long-chain fatty acid--CoA ligase [Streptosporangiaceae bacterium]|nr:long-chain fatty acid--CoA ligase [Streptosporangiaceae bacterium]